MSTHFFKSSPFPDEGTIVHYFLNSCCPDEEVIVL